MGCNTSIAAIAVIPDDKANLDPCRSITLLGGAEVGKSALIRKLIFNEFHESYNSTIEDSYTCHLASSEIQIKDTAGLLEYRVLLDESIINTNGILFCYDPCDLESIENLATIIQETIEITKNNPRNQIKCPILFVSCKSDLYLKKNLTSDKIEKLRNELRQNENFIVINSGSVLETSSKTGSGVLEVFQYMSNSISKMQTFKHFE